METLSNSVVLGYHGCRKDIAEKIFSGSLPHLRPSKNSYDWLGSGIYFWESDPIRGYEWAVGHYGEDDASVVGAAIHLGRCLNMMSRHDVRAVAEAYKVLEERFRLAGLALPTNGRDRMNRKLDCAVIEAFHAMRRDGSIRGYDTVRGLFTEGEPIFPGAGFDAKTHIQICVRDTRVIKGYLRVLPEHLEPKPYTYKR
jgi:hypothetical protein